MILELTNPELELAALDAESQLRAAEAQYIELKVRLQSQRLDQEAAAARVRAEYHQAKLRADTDAELAKEGLVADLTLKISKVTADELANRNGIEQKRLDISGESIKAQLAVQEAPVEQRRAPGAAAPQPGRCAAPRPASTACCSRCRSRSASASRPAPTWRAWRSPRKLKAVIRIAETQAKDVQIGQVAAIDTRNGDRRRAT